MMLGDKTFAELNLRVVSDYDHPIAPDTRDHTIVIPGRNGAVDMGADVNVRSFALPCVARHRTREALQKTVRDLSAHLFDMYGKPKTLELRFSEEPEKYYKVRYSGSLPISRLVGRGEFILPLVAHDPYAYAPATYYDPDFIADYDSDTEYDDGVTEYKNQTHTPFKNARQYAGVFNYSHFATPFSFVIEGYVRNPKITNLTSGVSAKFNGVTVEADERLYFDSKLMTTWKVKASEDKWFWLTPYQMMKYPAHWDKLNHYNNMSGHFLELVSGDNTILFEGEQPDAQVNFRWEHRFL